MTRSPLRICVGCRQAKPRDQLLRLTVDHRTGEVHLNTGSKELFGRSAYLCRSSHCLKLVHKGARLRYALEGRKKKKKDDRKAGAKGSCAKEKEGPAKPTIRWPLESQLITVIAELCADQGKTCHNTEQ